MPLRDLGVLLKWLIEGEDLNWLQIGTVMTEIEFMFHYVQIARNEHSSWLYHIYQVTTYQCTLGKFTLMHETTKVYDTMKPLKETEFLTAVNAQLTA